MVDAALAETGAHSTRMRKLPARVTVYLLLAAALFETIGHLAVWRKLTCALDPARIPRISAAALWQARTRLGPAPLRALFDLLRGPVSAIRTPGARFHGLLVCALDGTYLDTADSPHLRSCLGKGSNQHTCAVGYPQICLSALVACGTRAVIDAAFGPRTAGETAYGRHLCASLRPGMIVLLDRGFSSNTFLAGAADTGADFLARLNGVRRPPVLHRLGDGSFLSRIGGVRVRVIECAITITTSQGRRTGAYRLATTLLDHRAHSAADLVGLYHERWEIESAYFAIKKTILGRRVLRSRTPAGIAQEVYALLVAYQALRIAIADAVGTAPGTDPDRAGFSVALEAARDQAIRAANTTEDTTIDLIGTIGARVLNNLLPPRRLRISPRAVKRPLSRYAYKSLNIDRRSYKATVKIDLLTGATSP